MADTGVGYSAVGILDYKVPVVTISYPASGDILTAGATIPLGISVSDDSSIDTTKVQLYLADIYQSTYDVYLYNNAINWVVPDLSNTDSVHLVISVTDNYGNTGSGSSGIFQISSNSCEAGYVPNCSPNGESETDGVTVMSCCSEAWIGDDTGDCSDQKYGCDLTCYNNDGGDCGEVNPGEITGCMNSSACNYSSIATSDDGSCWYANPNCNCSNGEGAVSATYWIDNDGDGLGAGATSSSHCEPDNESDNWVPNNSDIDDSCNCTNNDSSCYDSCGICGGDGSTCETQITCNAGEVVNCSPNYESNTGVTIKECCPENWVGDGAGDCEDQPYGCDLTCYNNDGGDCVEEGDGTGDGITGCTIEEACNYNYTAVTNDGSCWFANQGCSCNFGEGAEVDECGVCGGDGPETGYDCDGNILGGRFGCTDISACNYDEFATEDDGHCNYACTCDNFITINSSQYCAFEISILQKFIDNSSAFGDGNDHTLSLNNDTNNDGIIDPLELGNQVWVDGRLEEWDCNQCGLMGGIPSEIKLLYYLRVLDLSENHLTGNISEILGFIPNLNSISIANNHFRDDIPVAVIQQLYEHYLNDNEGFSNYLSFLESKIVGNSFCENINSTLQTQLGTNNDTFNGQQCEKEIIVVYPIEGMIRLTANASIPIKIITPNFNLGFSGDGHIYYNIDDPSSGVWYDEFSNSFVINNLNDGDHSMLFRLVENNDDRTPITTGSNNEYIVNFSIASPIQGCMDDSACNYNESATEDDGSCEYKDACGVCYGNNNCLSYPDAITGEWLFTGSSFMNTGCQFELNCNDYSDNQTICEYFGCEWNSENEDCSLEENYFPSSIKFDDDGSHKMDFIFDINCVEDKDCNEKYGTEFICNLASGDCEAEMYDEWGINEEDQFCIKTPDGGGSNWGCTSSYLVENNQLTLQISDDGNCTELLFESAIILGCTDNAACNFEDTANEDDGSCILVDCGNCDGDNSCIPQIMDISISPNNILPLNTKSIEIEFSNELDGESSQGVSISSSHGDGFSVDVGSSGDNKIILISFNELTSGGTINIDIDASMIRSGGVGFEMNNVYTDSSWSYYITYVGDYNNSGYDEGGIVIDTEDIATLISNWGTDNYEYELGPCLDGNPCSAGDLPYLKPEFDGQWDIEDIMAFVLMWNWSSDNMGRVKKQMDAFGLPPILEIIEGQLIMNISEYTEPISHIWFEINTENSTLLFESSDNDSQFDLALNREFENGKIKEMNLINLNGSINLSEVTLGNFKSQSKKEQKLEIQYKISTKNEILSSGSQMLIFSPIPDNFELSPAYPNPFNPITSVQYAIPVESDIVLSVYNVQGRLVTYLENGVKSAGYYETAWNASNHASGMYFIRMNVYNSEDRLQFSKMQKIILVK